MLIARRRNFLAASFVLAAGLPSALLGAWSSAPAAGDDGSFNPVLFQGDDARDESPLSAELAELMQPGGVSANIRNPALHIARGGPDTSGYKRPAWVVFPDARYEIQGRSPMQGRPGSVKIQRQGYGANLIIGPDTDVQISIPFDYEQSYYRFRGTQLSAAPEGPVRDLHQWLVAPNVEVRVAEDWVVFGGGVLVSAGQWGADFGDSTRYGGFAGARYLVSDHFNFSFGFSGFSRLESDATVLPVIGFEWAFADHWRLYTEGNEMRLEFDPTDWITLKTVIGYEAREFRLDDNAPSPNGVFQDSRVPLTFGFDFIPHPALTLSANVGLTLYQQIQVDSANGDRISHQQVKPAPIFNISLELTF